MPLVEPAIKRAVAWNLSLSRVRTRDRHSTRPRPAATEPPSTCTGTRPYTMATGCVSHCVLILRGLPINVSPFTGSCATSPHRSLAICGNCSAIPSSLLAGIVVCINSTTDRKCSSTTTSSCPVTATSIVKFGNYILNSGNNLLDSSTVRVSRQIPVLNVSLNPTTMSVNSRKWFFEGMAFTSLHTGDAHFCQWLLSTSTSLRVSLALVNLQLSSP